MTAKREAWDRSDEAENGFGPARNQTDTHPMSSRIQAVRRLGSSCLLRTDCLFVCCAQTVLLLVSIWSSAGPSEKGLVTNSRKSIGRLKRSPHPPSPPTVFKLGYVTYSMSICMFISFYSRFLLYIQCYMLWHLSFPDFWSKILYGLHRLFNEEISIFCESQFNHMHLKDYLPKNYGYRLVFESPVRSGLLAPSALDRNRNRSFQFQKLQKTGPNRYRPVICGLLRLQDRF